MGINQAHLLLTDLLIHYIIHFIHYKHLFLLWTQRV